MSNLFVNLPVPAGDGVGAAVDTSALGKSKSIILGGALGDASVTVQVSNDGGTTFVPLITFTEARGITVKDVAAEFMRVLVQGAEAGFSAVVDVAGNDGGGNFASLPMPAGDGVGAAVDVSAFGNFYTAICTGVFTGASITIEASEDGSNYAPVMSFSGSGGLKSQTITAQFLRTRVSGRKSINPFTATVAVGACQDSSGGGAGTGRELLPECWQQQDVPAAQAATAMPTGVSQLFDNYQTIRGGSVVGINLRADAVLIAGTLTGEVTINGVGTGFTVVITAPASSNRAVQAQGLDAYVAGDLIGVTLASSADLDPETLDVEASVEVDTET